MPAAELRRRIDARVLVEDDEEADAAVERRVAARDDLPAGTLILRADQHTSAQLADLVLAAL